MTETAPSNKSKETNQKPAGGFLIAHFKRSLHKLNHIGGIANGH